MGEGGVVHEYLNKGRIMDRLKCLSYTFKYTPSACMRLINKHII